MDAKKCDVTGEYYDLEEEDQREYCLCKIVGDEVEVLDTSPKLYKKILSWFQKESLERTEGKPVFPSKKMSDVIATVKEPRIVKGVHYHKLGDLRKYLEAGKDRDWIADKLDMSAGNVYYYQRKWGFVYKKADDEQPKKISFKAGKPAKLKHKRGSITKEDLIKLVNDGKRNFEIASILGVAPATVTRHMQKHELAFKSDKKVNYQAKLKHLKQLKKDDDYMEKHRAEMEKPDEVDESVCMSCGEMFLGTGDFCKKCETRRQSR